MIKLILVPIFAAFAMLISISSFAKVTMLKGKETTEYYDSKKMTRATYWEIKNKYTADKGSKGGRYTAYDGDEAKAIFEKLEKAYKKQKPQ